MTIAVDRAMIRLLVAMFALALSGFSQLLPSYQWAQEVDASKSDTLAGLGTDSAGNIYIVGSTSSATYPMNAAVQGHLASSGLYLIKGTDWSSLGLSSVSGIAASTQNPGTLYVASAGSLLKSTNGGATFTALTLPGSPVYSIVIAPGNDETLIVGTGGQGVLKSADGGATWIAVNTGLRTQTDGSIFIRSLWIDPANPSVLFAWTQSGLERSSDSAAHWQLSATAGNVQSLTFDTATPGVVYSGDYSGNLSKSTDGGQTFGSIIVPRGVSEVLPDPLQSGRLIAAGDTGIYQSIDGGTTWVQESTTALSPDLVADPLNGVYYAASWIDSSVLRISGDLQTVTPVGPPATGFVSGLVIVNGQVYAANSGSGDVFVTKLDPSGTIVYSTYFGGSANDQAVAMTVDAAGNVYVTGTTKSLDFPVSKGAYALSGNVFVFKLNPDGSLGYSTHFSGTTPVGIAVNANESAWLAGTSQGGLPVTPGALGATFCCALPGFGPGPPIVADEASLTRFDAAGSSLIFSTYVAGSSINSPLGTVNPASALALAPDDTAYVGGGVGIFHIDSTGSTLLSKMPAIVEPVAMTLAPDATLLIAGTGGSPGITFQPTVGAFQATPANPGNAEVAVAKVDLALKNVIAATYFSNRYGTQLATMTTDAAGNVYLGGKTASLGLATRTPFNGGFASPTGFLSELSGDLSTLIFSSYFGDNESFTVSGLGIGSQGSVIIGGTTGESFGTAPLEGNVWLNSLALTPPPAFRIDAVANAASLLDGPLSAGETIVIHGAGFGSDAQVSIGGAAVAPISIAPAAITLTVPPNLPDTAAAVVVQSGGATSNQVLMPVAGTAPGIFSANGTGAGQGYILNQDGTLNTPANPAAPGDKITILATGVGPMFFTQCCAVTQYPVNVFINNVYCAGVAAILGPVSGLPGSVYQITVYVPNSSFRLPALSSVAMQVNGASSQAGISISIAQ